MDQSSPNKGFKQLSIFDLFELDGDEDDDEYNPAEEEEGEDEEEELVEDLFLGEPTVQQLHTETSDIEMSESDMIARRTRSKFQIEEEPKDTLEFPDVTKDLYEEAMAEDDEWSIFLKALFQDDPSKLLDEDEAKDPDYEFEDVNEIIRRETAEAAAAEALDELIPVAPVETIDLKSLSSSDLSEWSKFFTKEDIELLYHQMAQHVQLLTQHYLLTMTSSTLGHIAENCAFLLKELNQFAQGKEVSLFKAPNLSGSLKIVEDHPINPSNITVIANSWRQCPVPIMVRPIIALNPQVFCYHELLPYTGYPDVTAGESKRKCVSKTKTKFNRAEDHLIALGLEQLKEAEKKLIYHYLRQLLIPVKSVEQISMHIKNKKRHIGEKSSGKCDENNPLTFYLKHGKLLPIERTIPVPKQVYSPLDKLPEWLLKQLDPQFTSTAKVKVLPRLKHSPMKGVYSLKYPTTAASPNKPTSVILRRYRYLSKLPYIKPKPNALTNQITNSKVVDSPGIRLINLEKAPSPGVSTNDQPSTPASSSPPPPPPPPSSSSPPTSSMPVQDCPPLVVNTDDQCNSLESDSILTVDTEMISKDLVNETDGSERIDVLEATEEVVYSETFDEPDQSQFSSPGQQSTNLTSKSDSPSNPYSVEKESELIVQNEENDDESDLAALMVASSTITSNKGRNKSHDPASGSASKKEAKKLLITKHKESTVLLLSEEDWLLNDNNREQKEQIMVQCFINKVREALKSDEDYVQFLTYLSEFGKHRSTSSSSDTVGTSGASIKDLHRKTEKLLRKVNAQQVMEDFVLLLNASQAQECGKMYQYLHWRRYLSFIRKLEVYSAVEPNCIPRLHKTLIQLKSSETPVNKQRLKAAVSKAISGHPYLINEFSSLFLDEKPKGHLFASDEDFDNLVITNVSSAAAVEVNSESDGGGGGGSNLVSSGSTLMDDSFENVLVDLSSEERKYGTNECPCKLCHNNTTNSIPSTSSNVTIDSRNSSTSNPIPAASTSTTTVPSVTTVPTNPELEGSKRTQQSNQSTNVPPLRHCTSCSLRFIGGKIYLQGPKKIQPAEVQYTATNITRESLSSIISCRNQQSTESSQSKQTSQPTLVTTISPYKSPLRSVDDQPTPIPTETINETTDSDRPWSLSEDKLLLEFCKAKVTNDDEANLIELFSEVATKLNRPCDNVVERFNKLMELFKHEATTTINQPNNQSESSSSINQQESHEQPQETVLVEVISTDLN